MNGFEKEGLIILYVEDSKDDVFFMNKAFERNNIKNRLYIVQNGEEALDYLFHRNQYAQAESFPAPGLMVLDLKLPRIDGVEVLRIIKGDPNLRTIPVIMLTTSTDQRDVDRCYDIGVNSYLVKPTQHELFNDLIGMIAGYWLNLNILPNAFMKRFHKGQG